MLGGLHAVAFNMACKYVVVETEANIASVEFQFAYLQRCVVVRGVAIRPTDKSD